MASRRGVVSVVTGGGKTLFALHCYEALRASVPDLRLVVIVPTTALMDQWAVALQCDLGLASTEVATFGGEGGANEPRLANVMVINTARRAAPVAAASGTCMLVVDECHRAGSPENARALDGAYYAVLGLSATPQRQYDDGFERFIVPALGPVIHEYGYAEARSDGVIAPFELHNVEFSLTASEQARYDKLTRQLRQLGRSQHGVWDDRAKERAEVLLRRRAQVSVNARLRVPVAIATIARYTGKAIVFHERISAAEELSRVLNAGDRRSIVYHSKIYGPVRRDRLRLFRTGAVDTLVTCRSLDEGLNVPDAKLAFLVASTSSRRQRIQRLGRVLRTGERGECAKVVTFFATEAERRQLLAEAGSLADVAEVRWFTAARREWQ